MLVVLFLELGHLFEVCLAVDIIIIIIADNKSFQRELTSPLTSIKLNKNKCVSKTDTTPPFAFQIAFPRGTDFTGILVSTGRVKK